MSHGLEKLPWDARQVGLLVCLCELLPLGILQLVRTRRAQQVSLQTELTNVLTFLNFDSCSCVHIG